MKAATGLVTCCFDVGRGLFLGRAADLAHHQDGLGRRVGLEQSSSRSMNDVPTIGSPPRPTHVDWPSPRLRQLPDGLVGQRAAAAHHADRAFLVNVAGHDADLALLGRDHAGAVRADEPRLCCGARLRRRGPCRAPGTPSVMATTRLDAGVDRFQDGVGGERPAARRSSWRRRRSSRRPRRPCRRPAALDLLARLARRHAADHLACRIPGSPWCGTGPTLPVMPWQMTRVFLLIEDAHGGRLLSMHDRMRLSRCRLIGLSLS